MPEDAVAALASAEVAVAVFPDDASRLVVSPGQLAVAVDALSASGWEPEECAGGKDALPDRLVFRGVGGRSITIVASMVGDPQLRRLFPIRTIDVLHRSGYQFRPVGLVHTVDRVLHACMHHASTGDGSFLEPALAEACGWDDRQRRAFLDIVRHAGAQLPVLVALDVAGSELAASIGPRYRVWRWAARRSPAARRHTRRSTVGSLGSVLGLLGRGRVEAEVTGEALVEAIALEAGLTPRHAPHNRWRALAAMSPRQLLDAWEIMVALGRVERRLRSEPFADVVERTGVRLDFGERAPTGGAALPTWAQEEARLVERVGRVLLPGNPCLRTSIVIAQRLRRFDPVVRIGVRGTDGRFDSAHAWVEVAGMTFGEDDRFAPFVGPSSPRS